MVKVLIVDDDSAICEFLTISLSEEGHSVHAVAGGDFGLAAISTFYPDVVILDLYLLPNEVSNFIAAYQRVCTDRIPIVALSTSREIAKIASTLNVAAFLSKPFDLNELIQIIGQTRPQFLD